jgi:hypothetical protein
MSVKFRLSALLLGIGTALFASDVSGDWEFANRFLGDVSYARVTLQASGDRLTGSLNELKLEGTVKGDELTFKATRPNGDHFGDFKGSVRGDELSGTAVWFEKQEVAWSAKRPVKAPAEPKVKALFPATPWW